MRQVMIHKPHPCLGLAKALRESLASGFLVPHAGKVPRGIQHIQISDRPFPQRVEFQVVQVDRPGCLPAEAHFIQLLSADSGKLQASLNRQVRKARVVLLPANPLFRYGKEQFSITHNASRRIVHLRIINPKRQHPAECLFCS